MSLRSAPTDGYSTPTSDLQASTEVVLEAHVPLNGEPAKLNKNAHIQFLIRNLVQGFPARYTSQDASQPWLLFWTLQSFSILQVALDPGNKQKAIDTILSWQHAEGGFGGGPKQAAHLLPTYAAVSALANVGRPGPGGGWDQIDRKKMYSFFMSLKQPDGSFLVAHYGEVDIRGIYCLLVTANLLDLLTPELVEGTASFIASIQTYEGGFSCASQPFYDATGKLLESPRPPLGEAHGGYTFCALASWVILEPFIKTTTHQPKIDKKRLLRWLVSMQGNEIEIGGFKGRTNKLVDGCYSWWVGGAFALLEAIESKPPHSLSGDGGADDEDWDDVDDSLLNRKALQEYIIYAAQHPAGGLRDKPPKGADAYHTLYCLAGLSAAQHHVFPCLERSDTIKSAWVGNDVLKRDVFTQALSWTEEEGTSRFVGGKDNRVNATHPVFNLTISHVEEMMGHFYGQNVPKRTRKKAAT